MQHKAHIAHHVKGRLRVRVPSAKGNPKALEEIKRSLASLTGVHEVEVSPTTGSVTVHYDPSRHADFHQHLAGDGQHKNVVAIPPPPKLSEVDEMEEMLEREAEYLASHSHTAKALVDFIRKCDVELKRASGNQLDLKVLTPLALAVYAFLELGIEAATPVWLTLGIFSFNHFVDLHVHHDVAPQADCPPTPAPRRHRVQSV
jgi:cation transport ATPase